MVRAVAGPGAAGCQGLPWPWSSGRRGSSGKSACGKAILAATVTVTGKPNPAVWSPRDFNLGVRAVYAHRLITARRYAGWDLGAELLDWTGSAGPPQLWRPVDQDRCLDEQRSASWLLREAGIRASAAPAATSRYPSGVLLEKPISKILYLMNPQFAESAEVPAVFSAAGPEDPPYVPFALTAVDPVPLDPGPRADLYGMRISEIPLDVEEPAVAGCSLLQRDHAERTVPRREARDRPLCVPARFGW